MEIYITGILALLIYLPIFLFMLKKDFRERFNKINSRSNGDFFVEIVIGFLYFLIIFLSFLEPINFGMTGLIGIFIYLTGIILTYLGYYVFYTSRGLISKNVYMLSRNPTYFFGFMAIFGIVLMTLSLWIFLLLIFLFILTDRIVKNEENFLEKEYGKKYKKYKKKVRRWI